GSASSSEASAMQLGERKAVWETVLRNTSGSSRGRALSRGRASELNPVLSASGHALGRRCSRFPVNGPGPVGKYDGSGARQECPAGSGWQARTANRAPDGSRGSCSGANPIGVQAGALGPRAPPPEVRSFPRSEARRRLAAPAVHVASAKVLLGRQQIVGRTPKLQVVHAVRAAQRVRFAASADLDRRRRHIAPRRAPTPHAGARRSRGAAPARRTLARSQLPAPARRAVARSPSPAPARESLVMLEARPPSQARSRSRVRPPSRAQPPSRG